MQGLGPQGPVGIGTTVEMIFFASPNLESSSCSRPAGHITASRIDVPLEDFMFESTMWASTANGLYQHARPNNTLHPL